MSALATISNLLLGRHLDRGVGVLGAVALAVASAALAPAARAEGPFGSFSGSWSGAGQVKMAGGQSEPIKCKVYYTNKSATDLSLALRCASASAKIEMRASLAYAGGAVTGSWEERSYNATGTVSGKANNDQLNLAIDGGGLSGKMSVQVNGGSQTVSISTNGAGFTGVNIQLSKG